MKKRDFQTISFMVFLVAMLLMGFLLYPLFKDFKSIEHLAQTVESYGVMGVFVLLLIQAFQVIVAIIPGEVLEFVSGLLYGTLGGFFICMAGMALGQIIIFKMVSVWGQGLLDIILDKKFVKRFSFLKDENKVRRIIFVLFFIPGTPKDLLTYFVPITKIKMKEFMVISFIARIPSVISSTYAGAQLTRGNILSMIIIYGVMAIFGIIGLIVYDKFFKKDKNNG